MNGLKTATITPKSSDILLILVSMRLNEHSCSAVRKNKVSLEMTLPVQTSQAPARNVTSCIVKEKKAFFFLNKTDLK